MNTHQSHLSVGEQQQRQRCRNKRQKVDELSEEQKKEIEIKRIEKALQALLFPEEKSPFTSDF